MAASPAAAVPASPGFAQPIAVSPVVTQWTTSRPATSWIPAAQPCPSQAAPPSAPLAPPIRPAAVTVQKLCGGASTCTLCTALPECGWCALERRCVEGNKLGPRFAQCVIYDFNHCTDIPCTSRSTCSDCVSDHACGWCAARAACVKGSSTGPFELASCPGPLSAPDGRPVWAHAADSAAQCLDVPPLHPNELWDSLRGLMYASQARVARMKAKGFSANTARPIIVAQPCSASSNVAVVDPGKNAVADSAFPLGPLDAEPAAATTLPITEPAVVTTPSRALPPPPITPPISAQVATSSPQRPVVAKPLVMTMPPTVAAAPCPVRRRSWEEEAEERRRMEQAAAAVLRPLTPLPVQAQPVNVDVNIEQHVEASGGDSSQEQGHSQQTGGVGMAEGTSGLDMGKETSAGRSLPGAGSVVSDAFAPAPASGAPLAPASAAPMSPWPAMMQGSGSGSGSGSAAGSAAGSGSTTLNLDPSLYGKGSTTQKPFPTVTLPGGTPVPYQEVRPTFESIEGGFDRILR